MSDGYILVCDGTMTVNPDNSVSCDNWVAVPKENVFPMDLTVQEVDDLATATLAFFAVCFVVKILRVFMLKLATDSVAAE